MSLPRSAVVDASVVHQEVDTRILLQNLIGSGRNGGEVRQVGRKRDESPRIPQSLNLRGRFRQALRVPSDPDHRRSLLQQRLARLQPNPARRTRHNRNDVLQRGRIRADDPVSQGAYAVVVVLVGVVHERELGD